jgi:soluble lytic murein transglycosylase
VIPSSRAAALRSTALAASLALAVGSLAVADAWANPKVPLPKPRPIARNVVPKTAATTAPVLPKTAAATAATPTAAPPAAATAAKNSATVAAPAPAAPVIEPATRKHAALPPPPVRKPPAPAAMATTSSTSQVDKDALENVIELVRKRKPADATQTEAAISDPVARKLAEWIILRSDDNGASVERYRAFISANPSWPSQTFMRRRIEAALWDDRRDDATVWGWFENE